jgi:type IX secretion system PorP/SprF family membrane protein
MKKLIASFCLTFCVAISGIHAQDFHLSLYDAAPLFLNPGLTGVVDAKYRVHAQYRNQWRAVAFKPFNTALISFDMPKGKWGFGGQITEMRAGIGNYNVFQALGSAAYTLPLDKNRFHTLTMGLQAGVTQKSVEYKLHTFDSQWSTRDGGSFDKELASNENFNRGAFFQEQVNFGLMYYYGKQQSRVNPFLGLSAFNLTQPKETFFGTGNRLPMRLYAHAGARVNVSELLYFLPKILVMNQQNVIEQVYSIDAGYFFKGEKFYLLAGYSQRIQDASVVWGGFRKDNLILKLGYDVNTSSLRTTSKTRGAFEISLTYMGLKNKSQEIKNCPRL